MLRIVIVDSDAESRGALRRMLGTTPGVVVVAEFAQLPEALLEAPGRRPDILLVEVPVAAGHEDRAVEVVRRFAAALPETAIIATGAGASAEVAIGIMRAGAIEFLPRPVERECLRAALHKLERVRRGSSAPAPRAAGRVTSVFSTKGGLGVTTLAINLAVCLAERAPNTTLLVELDTRQSDIATFLDVRPTYSVLDAFENIERLDESFLRGLLTRHQSGLWVLPGPLRMERAALGGEHVRAGLEIIRSHFGNVVLDLRHDSSPGTMAGIEASDTILFLTSLNVSALRSGAAGIAGLRHLGVDMQRVKVVVMREETAEDVTLKDAREVLGMPIYWRTPNDYTAVIASINAGRPVMTASPKSKITRNLRQLADLIAAGGAGPGTTSPRRAPSMLGFTWNPRGVSGAS